MADDQMTDARKRLITQAGAKVRKAIIKRSEVLQRPLLQYDKAVESGDDSKIATASIVLLVAAGLADPVEKVLHSFAETDRLLQEVDEDAG